MTSVQRYLHQGNNAIDGLTADDITASSVRPAAAVERVSVARAGSGQVRLVGSFEGHEEATIDVRIVGGGSTLRASEPSFAGVGNGTLTVQAVDVGAVAQTYEFTLADLGTETTAAGLALANVRLVASASGAAGNALRISATPDLTLTDTAYSLIDAWTAGTERQTGAQWDFGALPLTSKGEVDPATPRIRFGADPTVYRPFKEFTGGVWSYGLSPALERDVAAGTAVYTVTGGYDIEVTDGVTTETYAGVITLHELCAVLLANSALVTVSGVVSNDLAPGGMAVVDVPLRTAAWVMRTSGVALTGVAPAVDAPTETITVRCTNADTIGSETWRVEGALSGVLGEAVSGEAFTSDVISLTVPDKSADVSGTGSFSWRFVPAARAAGDPGIPSVGLVDVMLGINARPGTYTFTYEERANDASCDYTTAAITGRVGAACLGLDAEAAMALDANYQSRLESLYGWRSEVLGRLIHIGAQAAYDDNKRKLVDAITSAFSAGLAEIYASADARTEWDAALTAMQDDIETVDNPVSTAHHGDLAADPYTGDLIVGYDYTLPAGARYKLVRAVETASGDDLASASVTALDLSGWPTDDAPFDKADATYTLTFVRTEMAFGGALDGHVDVTSSGIDTIVAALVRKYEARMDKCRTIAGIVPKPDASSISAAGDGCWRDDPGATHWWVDPSGKYFSAFSNLAYISSAKSCGTGASAGVPVGQPYSTKEFGFAIAVACDARLKVGDQVVLTIASVDGVKPYNVGDVSTLDVVAGAPAYLTGGVDGDDTHTWRVTGSVDGALGDYLVDLTAPGAYHDGGIQCLIAPGGIANALGDTWTVSLDAAQFQWRKNGGDWSTAADIEADDVALSDGLSARFTPGAAPVWLDGDAWAFRARQPYAPEHLMTPDESTWQWSGASASVVVDLGAETTVPVLAVVASLPDGAALTIEGGDGATWSESEALTVTRGVAVVVPDVAWSVSHVRVSVSGASGGAIRWVWVGEPMATYYSADTCTLGTAWAFGRGGGLNPSRRLLAQGASGLLRWDNTLRHADMQAIMAMLQGMAEYDVPMILVPHIRAPSEAALVRVDMDSVIPEDRFALQPNDPAMRHYSLSMELSPVMM